MNTKAAYRSNTQRSANSGSMPPNNANMNTTRTNNASTNNTLTNNASTIATVAGWIEAAGNIVAAIGDTPTPKIPETIKTDLRLIGNVLQAVGSALAAENEPLSIDVLGDILQSAGNATVIIGILDNDEASSQRLETIGNELQLAGAGISINTQPNLTFSQSLDNVGNIIQVIGNTLQIYANPHTEEGVRVNALGSWTQAVGTVISALAADYND